MTYTSIDNYVGTDSFTYAIKDVAGTESNEATVVVTVKTLWTNPRNALDVNDDGVVTPIDAFVLITDLNLNGSRELPVPPEPPNSPPPYLDPSGDNNLSPIDAFMVVSALSGAGNGEGEAMSLMSLPENSEAVVVPWAFARQSAGEFSDRPMRHVESTAGDPVQMASRLSDTGTGALDWVIQQMGPIEPTHDFDLYERLSTSRHPQLERAWDDLLDELLE